MKAIVNNSTCRIVARELLTRGTVGKTMEAEFSADWDGLAITATFKAGEEERDRIYTGEQIIIPHEVLATAGVSVMLGFHGALPDGTIVKRTEKVWLNNVSETLDPAGVLSSEPTPDWTAQVQNIATEAKNVADSVRSDADAGKFNGSAGEAGGYYTPAVTQPDENTMHVEFTPSKADMPAVYPTDITLPAGGGGGGSGEDGGYYTPSVTQTAENVMEISYAASKEGMPEVEAKEIALPAGPKGKDFTYDDFTPAQIEELKGPSGDAATFEISETETLEAGQPAAVTEVTGSTEQARKYKVSIPQGAKGDGGKSAYAYAVEGGYTGTEAEFAQKLAQEKYASPNALTFTGAVEGSYDGSEAVTVEIPSGGGDSGETGWQKIEMTLGETVSEWNILIPSAKQLFVIMFLRANDAENTLNSGECKGIFHVNGYRIGYPQIFLRQSSLFALSAEIEKIGTFTKINGTATMTGGYAWSVAYAIQRWGWGNTVADTSDVITSIGMEIYDNKSGYVFPEGCKVEVWYK